VPVDYTESIGLEHYTLQDDAKVEIVVPPGQIHRRDATWNGVQSAIGAGEYRGIIITSAFGYHRFGEIGVRDHRLFRGDEKQFLADFLGVSRNDEVEVLRRLEPHICASRSKCWLLTLVTKQDLWWPQRREVDDHYRLGEYGSIVNRIIQQAGAQRLRHELVPLSLVISNFITARGEVLAETAAGYDQRTQTWSIRRMWETLYALKDWEEKT
jgi:hypothetical protein